MQSKLPESDISHLAPELGDEASARRQLVVGLNKLSLATRHHAWAAGQQRGLTPTQGQILLLLGRAGTEGMRIGALAEQLAISQPSASVAVRTLTEKGLVQKKQADRDKRAVTLLLTQRGIVEANHAATWADFLLNSVDTLSTEEQAVFQRSLVKMIRTLQVRGEIPVARMCATCQFFRPNVHDDSAQPHHCAYVEAPFGDRQLRLDCEEFSPVDHGQAETLWEAFTATPPQSK